MRRVIAGLLLVAALAAVPRAQEKDRDVWLAAVERHRPGTWDEAAQAVSDWPTRRINAVIGGFPLRRGRPANMDDILLRAAILHGDIAMLAPDGRHRPITTGTRTPPPQGLIEDDGTFGGMQVQSPDWAIARGLFDALRPDPSAHDVVRLWYRATLAWMARNGQVGQAIPHQRRAEALFPEDPHVHSAAGWIQEILAAPGTQAMAAALDARPEPAGRGSLRQKADVPPAADALARAEAAYTAALEADETFTEARIRRARVVLQRGRPDEALADLQRALADAPDPFLRYLGLMFIGDALEATGAFDGARQAWRDAAASFPWAQSPHVALGRLALRTGDRAVAQRHLVDLLAIDSEDPRHGDPWWGYPVGLGRHVDRLMEDLLLAVAR